MNALSRIGGGAIVLGLGIHIVVNGVVKTFPPDGMTASQLEAYLRAEAGSWAIVHGARYLAFTCILLFAVVLFGRLSSARNATSLPWALGGLAGTVVLLANGVITNAVEMVTFHGGGAVEISLDQFALLLRLTRVLFTAEIVTWMFMIAGYSVAGWISGQLPRWICIVGLVHAVFALLTGAFIVSVISGGTALILADVASLTGLIWFFAAGVFLLVARSGVRGPVETDHG